MKPSGRLTIFLILAFSFILIAGGHGAGPFVLIQIGLIGSLLEGSAMSLTTNWGVLIWMFLLLSILGDLLLIIAILKKHLRSKKAFAGVCLLLLSWTIVICVMPEYKEAPLYTGVPFATLVTIWLWQYCKPKREEE